jgi:hypothetical protein
VFHHEPSSLSIALSQSEALSISFSLALSTSHPIHFSQFISLHSPPLSLPLSINFSSSTSLHPSFSIAPSIHLALSNSFHAPLPIHLSTCISFYIQIFSSLSLSIFLHQVHKLAKYINFSMYLKVNSFLY